MKKIFAGLFFCLLAGLIYFFIWSPVLWIQKIDVRPLASNMLIKEIVQNNLEKKIWRFIPQKSIILAPIDKIKEDILDNFPEIKEVIINKKATNLLIIEIIERQSIGIWCQTERLKIEATSTEPIINEPVVKQCFCLDKEGIIFRESPLISGSLILNIYSQPDRAVGLASQVTSPEMINFILKTAQGLSLRIDNFEIVSPEDLRARTSFGWQIYFNPTHSVDSQLKALEIILEEEIKETTSLEYIDLRIDGRVYYK